MAEYKTEEERQRERERAKTEKKSADERIALLTKEKEADALKLREVRKKSTEAAKAAKATTLAANKKSSTFPVVPAHYVVAPGAPIVAGALALADGRVGSKEDVVSFSAAAVGLLGAAACAFTDYPTGALAFATLMGGGLASAISRRTRAWGAKMRAESGKAPPAP